MIFHIRSNYYIDKFNYLIISKGIILLTGDQDMQDYVSTMAIALSAEMAPVATIVVWHIGKYGEVHVDSLTFPVNGISRNKVCIFLYDSKKFIYSLKHSRVLEDPVYRMHSLIIILFSFSSKYTSTTKRRVLATRWK